MKLKIITYATHVEGYYNILIKQLKKNQIDYKIIGYGKKWEGFFQKFLDVYKYLETQDNDTIILFVDGFDSIILENKKKIITKYKKLKKKIIFGIEDLQNNLKKILQNMIFSNNSIIINSGSYIGQNKYLKKLFKMIFKKYGENFILDDQIIINNFINTNDKFISKYVGFDIDKLIFANMSNKYSFNYLIGLNESNYIIDEKINKIINMDNNISPSIISGCGNFDMIKYVEFLGQDKNLIIKRSYKTFMLKNFLNYLKTYYYIYRNTNSN
jgi:hypothetical protein